MAPILRKYNVAATIDGMVLRQRGTQDFKVATALFAGDVKVSKDGGGLVNIATLPTITPASERLIRIVLSPTEMQAARVVVLFVDISDPKFWEDAVVVIETFGNPAAQYELDLDTDVAKQVFNAARASFKAAGSMGEAINRIHADTANKKIANKATGEITVFEDDGIAESHRLTVQNGATDDEVVLNPT